MTEISIIIPVYNAEKVLKTTLNSVLAQTFTDFEAICINDGSSDSSWQILQEFAQTDSRFKIYNQENAGGSIARNNGLEKASGKYIAFLDNDDIYHPQYLEILYKNLKSTNADVSCCSYLSFEGYGDYSFCHKIKNNKIHFVSANPFTDKFQKKKKIETLMWTKLYKKELLNNLKFSPKLPAINDILFNMEILLSSSRVVVTKQKLIAYRLIETSQTRQKLSLKKLDEYKNLAMEINALGFKYPQHRKLLEKIAANYVYGMYAKDVFCASASENKQSLAKRIIEDLDFLHSEKIINFSRLNYKKKIHLWRIKRKIKQQIQTKEYDIIYSLGSNCACALYLNKNHLRKASGPFDWLTGVSFMPRIRLIADDFNGFINIEDFEKIPQAPKNEKTDYYKNTKTGFSFFHDFPKNIPLSESFDSVKQKYLRRIDRFYQNIRAGSNVLLVWFSLDEQTKNEDIIEASTCLNEKFHKNIDFLIIEHDESLLNQNIKFSLLTPNIFKYQLYAKNLVEKHEFTKGNVKKCTAIFTNFEF